MSDGIQTQQFDGQPFGHRWGTSRDLPARASDYGPPDPPRVRVGECPVCGVWRELRTGRVVGHQLNNGELCRGSGLKPTDEDVS